MDNTQLPIDISPIEVAPNMFYVVKTDDTKEALRVARRLVDEGTLTVPCTLIYLQPHESIETLNDERLAEVGLQRIQTQS
jgi:2-keto-3-deoxy-6-phosphogluconate aldolase